MSTTPHDFSIVSKSESIRQLILDTGLPLNKAPDALGMSSSDFLKWWSAKGEIKTSNPNLKVFAQFFGITEEQIINGKYDPNVLRKRLFHDPLTLPEKYSINQFSFVRTSVHIFKYLVISRGQHFADSIAYQLNVSPLIYQNLNNRISLNYFIDLLDILESNGFSQKELDTLSGLLFLGIADSELFTDFKKSANYLECYTTLAKNLDLFDQNFVYHSEIRKDQYIMTALLPFDNHNHFKWVDSKIKKLQRYRQLLLGWFPYLCGLPPLIPQVTYLSKTEGIETRYVVNFPKPGLTLLSLM